MDGNVKNAPKDMNVMEKISNTVLLEPKVMMVYAINAAQISIA